MAGSFLNRSVSAVEQSAVDIRRSILPFNHSVKTTFDVGKLIPFEWQEVLPGDTFDINITELFRMATPLFPVMDTAFIDVFAFFVPNRLVMDDWAKLNGENTSAWYNAAPPPVPAYNGFNLYNRQSAAWAQSGFGLFENNVNGSLIDYFGLPTEKVGWFNDVPLISSLPFRAYHLVWNQYFRSQDLQDEVLIPTGNNTEQDFLTQGFFLPRPVCRDHDYFSDCLPGPQKAPSVLIPGLDGAVVLGTQSDYGAVSGGNGVSYNSASDPVWGILRFHEGSVNADTSSTLAVGSPVSANGGVLYAAGDSGSAPAGNALKQVTGLKLRLSNLPQGMTLTQEASIGALRTAFQIQKLYERDLYGTRYTEILRNHFGVRSPDGRLQRAEMLGSQRIFLNIDQVVQTSSTDGVTPQGNVAGYSRTTNNGKLFTKSFTEHGMILFCLCARTEHTYQNNIPRKWTRSTRFDFYWPELANITNQPVYAYELWANGSVEGSTPSRIFGYNDAWASYRYFPGQVTGAFRSNHPQSLDAWHYADNYDSLPTLSDAWIREPDNVARTLAQSDTSVFSNQEVIADIYLSGKVHRPMPLRSRPGLVDHF